MKAKFYLVGGAVRDLIMGVIPKDRDYVVVGANPEYMTNIMGMKQVGADFPVFLSANDEEYALARKEISTGNGYTDFKFEWNGVTLDEDLFRRDLTCNAIAMDAATNSVVDPYNGSSDIQNKIFRPVSSHFMEDPVRVLRVARLRARFGKEWTLSPELVEMCSNMSKKGMLTNLDSNRMWKELSRALMEPNPRLFFDTLLQLDCLHTTFPEIYRLLSAIESYRWHPEGNAYEHSMLVLTQSALMGYDLTTRYCALVHDIGKGLTKLEDLPRHYGHDYKGADIIASFSKKYEVPMDIVNIAYFTTKYHMYGHRLDELNKKTVVKMFDTLNQSVADKFVDVLHKIFICDERGRLGSENNKYDHLEKIVDWHNVYKSVKFVDVFPEGANNPSKIKDGMERARVKALLNVKD